MKKLFVLVICLCILVFICSGCTGSKNTSDNKIEDFPKPSLETNYLIDNTMNIVIPSIYKWGSVPGEEKVTDWEGYIRGKYGINFDLVYTDRISNDPNSMNASDYRIEMKGIEGIDGGGFIYIRDSSDLQELVNSGLIKPINEYIVGVNSLSFLNSGLYKNFTDSDGNIWAFPLSEAVYVSSRIYRLDWLNKADMQIPETVDEFYEYAKYVALSDPDGDGKKNTYITWFNPTQISADLVDIYRAFGCYSSYLQPISYNPIKGKYELSMLNENFINLMEFIKMLKNESLIIDVKEPVRLDYNNEDFEIASLYSSVYEGYYPEVLKTQEKVYGYGIKGINDRYFIRLMDSPALAVLNETTGVSGKMNGLADLFFKNSEIKYDLQYGIIGEDYFDMGNHYEAYMYNDNTELYTRIGISINYNEAIVLKKPLLWSKYPPLKEAVDKGITQPEIIYDALYLYDTDVFYTLPFNKRNNEIGQLNRKIAVLEAELYMEIFSNNTPPDEAIDKFYNEVKEIGVIDDLARINGE